MCPRVLMRLLTWEALFVSFLLILCPVKSSHSVEVVNFIRHITGENMKKVSFVTVDENGYIFILNKRQSRLQILDPTGKTTEIIGRGRGSEQGEFRDPSSIVIGKNQNIYVVDSGNDRVQVFDRNGIFLMEIGETGDRNGQFSQPVGLTVDELKNLYVTDCENDRVQVFSGDGIFLMSFGVFGDEPGEFRRPRGIVLDKKGRIYVADYGNNRIQVFDPDGNFLKTFGKMGSGRGEFDGPVDLKIDNANRLYVLDKNNNRMQVFGLNGKFIMEIGSEGRGRGQFREPSNIAIDIMGHIYLSDTGNDRVQEFALGATGKVASKEKKKVGAPKLKLAVLNFSSNNLEAAGYGEVLSDMFITALAQTGYFELVERKELQKVLGEQTLSQSGALEEVQKIGRLLGVDMAITGSVAKFGNLIETDIRVMSVETARIEIVQTQKTHSDAELRRMAVNMVERIKDVYRIKVTGPEAPASPTAIGKARQVYLRWQPNSEPDLMGYKIYRSSSPKGEFVETGKVLENGFTDTDLDNGKTYYYKVMAYDRDGLESRMSRLAYATTAVAPVIPKGLNAERGIRNIRLTWSPNPPTDKSGLELKGYRIYRSESGKEGYEKIADVVPEEKPSYTDIELIDGFEYFYMVSAFNMSGVESDRSMPIGIRTVEIPSGLEAESGPARTIQLRWNRHVSDKVEGYKVYRSRDKEKGFEEIVDISSVKRTTYLDRREGDGELGNNITYYYAISAYNEKGVETDRSGIVSATTIQAGSPPVDEKEETGTKKKSLFGGCLF